MHCVAQMLDWDRLWFDAVKKMSALAGWRLSWVIAVTSANSHQLQHTEVRCCLVRMEHVGFVRVGLHQVVVDLLSDSWVLPLFCSPLDCQDDVWCSTGQKKSCCSWGMLCLRVLGIYGCVNKCWRFTYTGTIWNIIHVSYWCSKDYIWTSCTICIASVTQLTLPNS